MRKMEFNIQLFGGRGASSSEKVNKYSGRFSDGSMEQLQQAKRNLNTWISRLQETVKSQQNGNKITGGQFSEQLKINKDSLKELKLQQSELKREFKKRKIKY